MSIIEIKIVHAEHAAIGVIAIVALVCLAYVWVKLGEFAASEQPTKWRAP
jgi:hypothetical protein